jgi:hypothetical protein
MFLKAPRVQCLTIPWAQCLLALLSRLRKNPFVTVSRSCLLSSSTPSQIIRNSEQAWLDIFNKSQCVVHISGQLTTQCHYYALRFKKDPRWLKCIVAALWYVPAIGVDGFWQYSPMFLLKDHRRDAPDYSQCNYCQIQCRPDTCAPSLASRAY